MTGRFEGKTILITGGAMGMGAATATRLSAEGAVIIIADINEEKGNEVAGAINPRLGRPEDMAAAIAFLLSKRPPAKQVAFTKQFRSLKGKANNHNHRHSRWLRNCSEDAAYITATTLHAGGGRAAY